MLDHDLGSGGHRSLTRSAERTVVVFRSCLLRPSETFIRHQSTALTTWRPRFLGAVRVGSWLATDSDVIAYPDTAQGRCGWLRLRLTGGSNRLRSLLAELRPTVIHAHFGGDRPQIFPVVEDFRIHHVIEAVHSRLHFEE